MNRRVAVTILLACPWLALAQRPVQFIGFVNSGSPNERTHMIEGFRKGLREGGFVDGQDVAIEYRWAEGRFDRLPALVGALVKRKVAVIVATGGMRPAVAAKAATSTIPIVFTGPQDPVKLGLVASLRRPGGNATGITTVATVLQAKRLEILRDLVPGATTVAFLVNPAAPEAKSSVREMHEAAAAASTRLQILNASNEAEIDAAFGTLKQGRAKGLLVAAEPLFVSRREQVVALAARHAIPTSYPVREFPLAGGLMSYGPDLAEVYRQAGLYAARILKGAKPSELPVIQSSKFELVVNRTTAKKLKLAVPREFLARVDEVVE